MMQEDKMMDAMVLNKFRTIIASIHNSKIIIGNKM